MKNSLIIGCVIFVCLLSSVPAFSQETVRIAIGDYPPAYSEYIREYGYKTHLLTEAFANVGITVEYTFYPWKRAYILTQQGKFDATGCWFKTEKRGQDGMQFSDPVEDVTSNFFYLKSRTFDWTTFDDLEGLDIGVTLGFTRPAELTQMAQEGRLIIDEAAKDEFALRKLKAERIDLFLSGPIPTYVLLRKIYPPETVDLFTHHPTPAISEPDYLLFSPQTDPALIEKFNQGLKQLKESGRFDEIVQDAIDGTYPILETKWTPEE